MKPNNIKMNKKIISSVATLLIVGVFLILNSCNNTAKKTTKKEIEKTVYPSDVIPFFDHWKLVLGDGSNVGIANNFEHKDFFYTTNDGKTDWVIFKAPNAGGTHGTSKNTRTELAQLKKWYPATADDKLSATLKVMNVSISGDDSKSSAHAVVVGQIHSADGHENEPLKIFYKKFPGHSKGSVYWNYEINTAGDDNSGRWDFSTGVWGDVSRVTEDDLIPEEPEDGIELGEEFSYEIVVKDGIMNLKFTSEGHETKTFTKNLIVSEYTTKANIPAGKVGVERETAYTGEGCFFKLGSYNQTNGVSTGAETYGGDIQKQYETGNYAEVWFKIGSISVSDAAVSNEGYFTKND